MRRLVFQICTALIATTVALEVGLQIASLVAPNRAEKRAENRAENRGAPELADTITILCVGDSHTYGAGVEPSETYPAQLEAALRKNHPARSFDVVNQGTSGVNSAYVAKRLERAIHDLRPQLVIVWVGANNHWNNLEGEEWGNSDSGSSVRRALLHSKLFRLATVLLRTRRGASREAGEEWPWPEVKEEAQRNAAYWEWRAQGASSPEISARQSVGYDMARMVDTAQALDTPIVFITYPQKGLPVSEVIEQTAARLGAAVVVTGLDRERALADGLRPGQLFRHAAGPHPSPRLYGYIVESLLAEVVEALDEWHGIELRPEGHHD